MKIKTWQKRVDQWIKELGVRYFDVTTNALLLSEEVGEFNRLVARLYGEQSFKQNKSKEEATMNMREELADIIFVTTCLANQLGIDLTEALTDNLSKKSKRDKTRHLDNEKLRNNKP